MVEIADTAATEFAVRQRVRDREPGDEGQILDVKQRDDGTQVCKVWFGSHGRGDLRFLTARRMERIDAPPARNPAWAC